MRRNRDTRKKRSKFTVFLLIFLLICAGIVLKQEYEIYQIEQGKKATMERINRLQKTQSELEQEKKNLSDPDYIEKLARDEYNMVKQNEVPVFILDKKHQQETEKK